MNVGTNTIESELFRALGKAGAVSKLNSDYLKKNQFKRAARTDKGVHAAANVVSFKAIIEDPDIVERINSHLPDTIRVWDLLRTSKSFNSKNMCGSRIYEYLIPSYVFLPPRPNSLLAKQITQVHGPSDLHPFWANVQAQTTQATSETEIAEIEAQSRRDFRADADLLARVKSSFKLYEGSHNFHNFTIGTLYTEPSAERYIYSVKVADPVVISGTEWLSIKLHGQSFMLHQIRKMVAMVALVIRTNCPSSLITDCFGPTRVNIPKAPSLGLLLERPVYDAYNKFFIQQSGREPITFDPYESQVSKFKQEYIYKGLFAEETEKHVFQEFFDFVDNLTVQDQNGLASTPDRDVVFEYLVNRKLD